MTQRITIKNLEAVAARINRETLSPSTAYALNQHGKHVAQIGNYHISQAYGGYCLHRIQTEGGGVSSPLSGGHIPARDLYNEMQAFLSGIYAAKEM